MTRSYRVQVERLQHGDHAGTNQAVAKQWLTELENAVEDKEVVALPFADPDLASLAHNGKSVTGSLSHLKDATDVAATTVETILHVTPQHGLRLARRRRDRPVDRQRRHLGRRRQR